MATALTGSLGWSAAHPLQLGGPPLIHSWGRLIAVQAGPLGVSALPLRAHAYGNDGVTPNSTTATFSIPNRPPLRAQLANGGYEQVTLEVAAPVAGLALGNVVRLIELGGPFPGFVYSGIVESFPDVRSESATTHQVVLTPFGAELTRVATQLVYTTAVDIAQAVRDAVATTQHCSCDQVSVPPATGIPLVSTVGGAVDFRGQPVNQVLDTCRSIAGSQWSWHCDELGRVWFQPQGSGAVYTLMGGQHYEERMSNGGDIQDRRNQVPAVGGVPPGGGANVQAVANGSSQATIGVRALSPPIQVPGVTDQATLTAIAAGILGTLDQVWTRVQIKALPPTGQANERHPGRIHAAQPGGAMIRYWEPATNPLAESAVGAGYMGPFIGQAVEYDGLYQQIEAGSIPVTSQSDIDAMVRQWAARTTANALQVTAAALNLNQTLTGSLQSSPGTIVGGVPAALWSLTQSEFSATDPNGVVRAEMGNLPANGVSPAQWGFRASDGGGSPIFDSQGLIAVMKVLGSATGLSQGSTGGSGSFQTVSGSSVSFSLSRQTTVLVLGAMQLIDPTVGDSGYQLYGSVLVDGSQSGPLFPPVGAGQALTLFAVATLASGSHTAALGVQQTSGHNWSIFSGYVYVFQLGS